MEASVAEITPTIQTTGESKLVQAPGPDPMEQMIANLTGLRDSRLQGDSGVRTHVNVQDAEVSKLHNNQQNRRELSPTQPASLQHRLSTRGGVRDTRSCTIAGFEA